MAQTNQELVVQIKADLSKLQKGLDGAEQQAKGFKARLAKIGKSLQGAFSFGAIFAGGALVTDGIATIKNFEQSVANLAAVTGKSIVGIKALKDSALSLGATTAYTATQVTGLQTELAKLGFREQDILNLTKPILNLAQATGSDLANAAALAGSVVQSFGLQASDTEKVVDIMTKSFTESALDIRKFEVGIRQVAPVAKNANVELSEVTAMLGLLANNGVRAETAGVGLRNIMLEAAKRGVPFQELLEQVNNSADKSATAMDLFGKENAAVGVIIAENVSKIDSLNQSLQLSAGTAQGMADTQLNTLQGSLTLLKSAWDGFILSLESGTGFIGHTVRKVLDGLSSALGFLSGGNEKVTNSLSDLRAEFNKQITVLQSNTLSNEAKRKVIERINTQYKDYLPNLITEKTTLGDLRDITKQVNDEFVKRITLQAQEARLAEKIKAISNAQIDLIKSEIRLEEIRIEKITANEAELAKLNREEVSLASIVAYSNKVLNENNEELSTLLEAQKRVNEQLNLNNKTTKTNATLIDDSTKAAGAYAKVLTKVGHASIEFGKVNHTIETVGVTVSNTLPLIEGFSKTSQQALVNLGYTSDEIASSFTQLVNVFQQGFQEIGRSAVQGLGLAETGLQGFLAVMIETAVAAIGVALAESLANGVLSSTKLAVSLGPAGLAALPLLIGGAISAVKAGFSKVPKFADGGIVNGSSFSGDRVMARVNSGEMILNRSQQANLFGMINRGGGGNERLVTQIAGNDLRVVLERAQRTNNRLR